MTARSTRMGWRILAGACALATGLWIGHLSRDHSSSGTVAAAGKERAPKLLLQSSGDSDSTASARKNARRINDTSLAFSRQQWAKLIQEPKMLAFSIEQCRIEVPVVDDVPLIGRLFDGQAEQPLANLNLHADFFGWDDRQLKSVRSSFLSFALDLQEAEAHGTEIYYPETGGFVVNYSSNQKQREQAVENLKTAIIRTIGSDDARKLFLLSGMDGLASPLEPEISIRNSADQKSLERHEQASPKILTRAILDKLRTEKHFRHLEAKIDWSRVHPGTTDLENEAR